MQLVQLDAGNKTGVLNFTETFGSSTSFWHDPRNFWIAKSC